MSDLETTFHQDMLNTYHESVKAGYRPSRFFQMVNESGGVTVAHRLMEKDGVSDGFTDLWERQRLDLTVEALILKPEYRLLFSDEERERARKRLEEVGYAPPWASEQGQSDRGMSNNSGELLIDKIALQELIEHFKQRYGSFESQQYLSDERDYKLKLAEYIRSLVAQDELRALIDAGSFDEAKAQIKRSYQRPENNLLNQWDRRPLEDAPAEELTRSLFDVLYGEQPFGQRFDAWVELLSRKNLNCWPAATYFLMLFDPSSHIFVKPTPFKSLLNSIENSLQWDTHPNAAYYEQLRRLAETLFVELKPLGARDLIDVQSFIWTVQNSAENEVTGAEAGLTGQNQIKIALQAMVDQGGSATIQQVYDAVEAHLDGRRLSQQGKDSLRTFINRDAVEKGYVYPYDGQNPVWRVTPEGRNLLDERTRIGQETSTTDDAQVDEELSDFEQLEPSDFASLEAWQASLTAQHPLVRRLITEYPRWLQQAFGDRITLRYYQNQELGIFARGRWLQYAKFNRVRGLYVLVANPSVELLEILRRRLSDSETLRPRAYSTSPGYRFFANTDADYELLKEITHSIVESVADQWPPEPLDGPAFVLIHTRDNERQRYGKTYSFSNYAGGEHKRLSTALEAAPKSVPPTPIYVVLYRPQPHYAFTAWARVVGYKQEPGTKANETIWTLTLEQHEFPVPVDARTLISQIGWLNKGLAVAFRGYSIRQSTPRDFQSIVNAARVIGDSPMALTDAAFTVLSQAGGGPLHIEDIVEQARQRSLLESQVSSAALASVLAHDDRFDERGDNLWALVSTSSEETFAPIIHAGLEASFWRIHFPRELWDEARRNGVIGIDWPVDSTNQSVQRFKRIKVGDRVVVYFRGAVIGSMGVVIRPYYDVRVASAETASVFSGQYAQRIGIAWADAPAEPVEIFDALKHEMHTHLYNRLKNPHTVIPISRDDYRTILQLLSVDDVGTPPSEIRLPTAWHTLAAFRDFAQQLEVRPYTIADLYEQARSFGSDFNEGIDEDDLIDDLRRLRLITSVDDESYQIQSYVLGDAGMLLRLMALALLLPIEGSPDRHELPARSVVPYLFVPDYAEREPINDIFTTKFGADAAQFLQWYAEAGFVDLAEDGAWPAPNNALTAPDSADPATRMYGQFLASLLAELEEQRATDLPHADGPLPPVVDLQRRLHELGRVLLIDELIVRRIYRSLMAGRHVVLSGPPGTGKTELAKQLPSLLWGEEPQTFSRLTTDLDKPPVETRIEQRHGYATLLVTATEDWGVRDVVGGIGPQLDGEKGLGYTIQHGALTRVVLQHYEGTDSGRRLPALLHRPTRRDYRDENGDRYRGVWLVIDEFTRAPVDAAFGSLLTTLSGGQKARLSVPAPSGELVDIPLPPDFRIIGTLNSFDRHFLNQMSEAIKRRFDFIDVPPPSPQLEHYEQGIAVAQALARLRTSGVTQIQEDNDQSAYRWDDPHGTIAAKLVTTPEGADRYELHVTHQYAADALGAFWSLFRAIRVFRQFGTAQAMAVYTNVLTGVLIADMSWSDALDTALADSLADQLQVLTRDEQQVIEAFVVHAGNTDTAFVEEFRRILKELPGGRQRALLHALHEADHLRRGISDIRSTDVRALTEEQVTRVFRPDQPLMMPDQSVFRKRLRDLIGERGL